MECEMMKVLTVAQMIAAEKRSDEAGTSLAELMENAAGALAEEIQRHCERLGCNEPLILAGKGNNGGDGIAAARILLSRGLRPKLMLCCGQPATELSLAQLERLGSECEILEYSQESGSIIQNAAVIADCIFGTGFKGEIRAGSAPIFENIGSSGAFIIACDVPSGANTLSGEVSRLTVRADVTVTMHAAKAGMLLSPARYFCGEIKVCDIGIPEGADRADGDREVSLFDDELKALLPERVPWGHKGTFGKLVCVCGSDRYTGAAAMSTEAAMRTGVGLTELISTQKCISALAGVRPEIIYSAAPDKDGILSEAGSALIKQRISSASAVLIGCGLGHNEESEGLVMKAVQECAVPLVIDADGINSLCTNIDILLKKRSAVILTPHPAELARLCGVSTAEIFSDREGYAAALAKKYAVTVVSKGAETIVTDGSRSVIIRTGNTALSKAGSGDMLAGAIGSFAAQGCDAAAASILGCCVIGKSARQLSERLSERGIIARDILSQLPLTLKAIENS